MAERRVDVNKNVRQNRGYALEFDYEGRFHGWGADYEEVDGGAGNYTAAIVERDNGMVALVHPSMMCFRDTGETRPPCCARCDHRKLNRCHHPDDNIKNTVGDCVRNDITPGSAAHGLLRPNTCPLLHVAP